MNSNHDKQLELAVSRELKALPELTAPVSVANRVMTAIARRATVPWYRRSWETWPVAWQTVSLATMLALFGGLCLAGWELSRTETVLQAMHRAGQWFSGLNSIGNTLDILVGAAALVVKKLGTTFIIACLVAAGLGYAIFLGLGTACFRLAFAKHQPSHL
jgi:hypothetical protein